MRILHVSKHACPRALKLARAQSDQGHKIYLATQMIPTCRNYTGVNHVSWLPQLSSAALIETTQALLPMIDVIHVHNDYWCDWMVPVMKAIAEWRPVIWDVHDLMSYLFDKPINPDELAALKACDGICSAGEGQLEILKRLHPTKPMVSYPPASPLAWFPKARDKASRLGLIMPVGLSLQPMGFRNLLDGFNELVEDGVPVLVYSAVDSVFHEYKKRCKATMMEMVHQDILAEQMTKMEAALVGAYFPNNLIDRCEPNKLYEAIAAGIPVIVANAKGPAKLVEDNGLGIACSWPEIPKALEEIRKNPKYRQRVQKVRTDFCMERFLDPVMDLYKSLSPEGGYVKWQKKPC